MIRSTPFDAAPCTKADFGDLDSKRILRFIRTARRARQFPLTVDATNEELLEHLNLLNNGRLTNAAVLLFSKNPQRFLTSSSIRCAHFHGTVVAKPIPYYQIYNGSVFDLVDQAVDFVLSKINRSIGTRAESPQAPTTYEIPKEVVTEAIVNAVAHRDYTSHGSVQVMLFADRLEIWNPGRLPPSLTLEKLRVAHASLPNNPLLAESLYLAEYIERMGTGTLDMIRRCREAGLPEPRFDMTDGFVATIRRSRSYSCVVTTFCGRESVPGTEILAGLRDGSSRRSRANRLGEVHFALRTHHMPVAVFAAAPGFSAETRYGWWPTDQALALQLNPLIDGGASIIPESSGHIPGLAGKLTLERDTLDHVLLSAPDLKINGGQQQPVSVEFGVDLRIEDHENQEMLLRVVDIMGQSALVEYRKVRAQRESQPELQLKSEPDSLELRILGMLTSGPLSKTRLSVKLGQSEVSGHLSRVIRSLVATRRIAITVPDNPNSRLQQYRLTSAGRAVIESFGPRVHPK